MEIIQIDMYRGNGIPQFVKFTNCPAISIFKKINVSTIVTYQSVIKKDYQRTGKKKIRKIQLEGVAIPAVFCCRPSPAPVHG